jgi:hypothetical protein
VKAAERKAQLREVRVDAARLAGYIDEYLERAAGSFDEVIGLCEQCGNPFVTVVHENLSSKGGPGWHNTRCGACELLNAANKHLRSASEMMAKLGPLRQRIKSTARKLDARIPHCSRCASGKSCNIMAGGT